MARGKLRIYLGAAPGVGKTYAMLNEGWRRKSRGTDVVVGFVETYGRALTIAQIRDLEVVPRRKIVYKGTTFEEMDVDAILARHPAQALVDELAHTNVPGSRNPKRWQDIEELLDAGIDVISTVNIQHLAGLNDVVTRITGQTQRETVPDAFVRSADQIELVDMSPEALRRRMAHGNIYPAEKVDVALANYFRAGNLGALRELALLWVADRVDEALAEYRERHGIAQPWETKERVVVALSGAPGGEDLVRRAARMAARTHGELIGVHVRPADGLARPGHGELDAERRLLEEMNGRYVEVTSVDPANALLHFARAENATQLVLKASGRSRWTELTRGSVINRVIRESGPIDVHVISTAAEPGAPGLPQPPKPRRLAPVPPRAELIGFILGTVGIVALGAVLSTIRASLDLQGALLFLLLGVIGVAAVGGARAAIVAAVVGSLTGDYFFTYPYHSLRIAQPTNIVAVVAFFAVAAVISLLIDRLARRTLQTARAQAEAEALAALAGEAVLSGGEALSDLAVQVRRTFDLDGVGILEPDGEQWRVVAAAGEPVADRPDDAPFAAELDSGAWLVLAGHALGAEDTRLLRAFVAQLRAAQEHARLELEASSALELAEANTLRAALLAAVSHDLRTPLASIKAAATSVLADDVAWTTEEIRGFCKTIAAEADRLTALVSNLLDMSRLQSGALPVSARPVEPEDVLYSAAASLASGALGIVIDVAEALPLVQVDPGLLERSLANIMANAQAWSPAGKAVRVEAGVAGGGNVEIRIIDQGPGISPDHRDHLFEPFQRLGDGAGGQPNGIGLGLAVAKGFVEAMGGELSEEDTPGGGATFVVSLVRAEQ